MTNFARAKRSARYLFVVVLLSGCERYSGSFEWGSDRQAARQAEPVRETYGAAIVEPEPVPDLAILVPRHGDMISQPVYNDMAGTVDRLPRGCRLYVLLKNEYGWFLQYPPAFVEHRTGRFTATNIRMATAGRWQIHVCSADASAIQELDQRANRGQWGAMPALPDGVQSLAHVTVHRCQ